LRRFLAALTGKSRKTETKSDSSIPSNHMVKDPVCGMYMDSRLAIRIENKSETFYFCSEGCKTKFIDPASGAGMGSAAPHTDRTDFT
jgi:YHS domain-containing protein